ncbi:DUF6922 domain-containing protein [Pseudotamlana haliotis]|uniref:DUF6922 domain-containing protein n=1 Tax=Pseudotamlana haliotis TaxID=2614804 RepID=UPI001CDA5540|nr:hypothetical protein [Tamlana haliotis]
MSKLRKGHFGDTDISKIDWSRQFKVVIHRVFERGNDTEKNEIRHFYGEKKVEVVLSFRGDY